VIVFFGSDVKSALSIQIAVRIWRAKDRFGIVIIADMNFMIGSGILLTFALLPETSLQVSTISKKYQFS
jgi:hypothetical protein